MPPNRCYDVIITQHRRSTENKEHVFPRPAEPYNVLMELEGKVALVTGAGRRLGRAIALALARAGADLAVHYNRSEQAAEQSAGEIRRLGRRAELLAADLADPRQIADMFAAVGEAFGRLDVLVNNAAVYERTPIETLTAEQWDAHFAVNARAPALCIRHALPLMLDGAAVVNIADSGAEKGWGGFAAYCASKAAIESLTRSTARALAARNIRVNAVAPGVAEWQQHISDKVKQKVLAQIPMKRAGTCGDVAEAVLFLIRSGYVTAQTLRVDGGWHMG